MIHQGDLYWFKTADSDHPHPHVVIQNDIINQSRIDTVVVCALTSNMKQANEPGNVLLEKGEGNLERRSIILVSKVSTVPKSMLNNYIGSLSKKRIKQIFAGMQFQHTSFFRQQNR